MKNLPVEEEEYFQQMMYEEDMNDFNFYQSFNVNMKNVGGIDQWFYENKKDGDKGRLQNCVIDFGKHVIIYCSN